MKKLFYLTLPVLLFSCKENKSKMSSNDYASKYPRVIDSMHLQNQYDEAKWTLYCIYSTDTIKMPLDTSGQIITFGELPLKFDSLIVRNDSVEINFMFYLRDSIPVDRRVASNIVAWGTVFKGHSKKIIQYTSTSVARYFTDSCEHQDCPDRFVNPLQPEVIAYINNNKNKIDPWFLNEAIRRGILK